MTCTFELVMANIKLSEFIDRYVRVETYPNK